MPTYKKLITTWDGLEDEVTRLAEFYDAAQECLKDFLSAIAKQSPSELREALRRHGDLKARAAFSVAPELFETKLVMAN